MGVKNNFVLLLLARLSGSLGAGFFGISLFGLTTLLAQTAPAAPQFPTLSGRVVDNANILASSTRTEITAQLAGHEKATSNQIVVVTLKSLQGYNIADYGYQLGRHWGIGQRGRNNGVLLIVAPKERKLRIEVGYGLEGVLTDAISSDIIERVIKPHLRERNFDQGVRAGVGAIIEALAGKYIMASPTPTGLGDTASLVVGLLLLGFLVVILVVTIGPDIGRDISRRSDTRYNPRSSMRSARDSWGDSDWGGGGGGGFSGGGGSFGGGGASGSW